MNRVERFVYDSVKSNPRLKKAIRNLYQAAFDVLPKRPQYSVNPIIVAEGYFFGFHDLQPFSCNNDRVLINRLPYNEVRVPTVGDYLSVGYLSFDGHSFGEFVPLGKTNAWNLHKGCRLQWLSPSEVIFNSTNQGRHVSTIVDMSSGLQRLVPYAIDTVSSDGKYATSFSYERLERHMPGYGYYHSDDAYIEDAAPAQTGLFLIDLETGKSRLLVDLESLAEMTKECEASTFCDHYVTHSEFSIDGRYVSFLHRWTGVDKSKRYTEFMLYDLATDTLRRLPTSGLMTSHYVWNESNQILAYCNFRERDAHVLFDVPSMEGRYIAYPRINSDGHQSFINDSTFVTDTYPDKWRMSHLYKVDIDSDRVELIASVQSWKRFQSSPEKGHVACDLHPRVSHDGQFVCFDTVHTGSRAIAVMRID